MTTRLWQQKRLNAALKKRLRSPSQAEGRAYPGAQTQLEPRFPLVTQCEDGYLKAVKSVEHDVAAFAEADRPNAVFRVRLREGAPKTGLGFQNTNLAAYRANGTPCRVGILRCQESIQALHVGQRRTGPDQPWHSGGSALLPVSNCASHASASSPLTCWPVA